MEFPPFLDRFAVTSSEQLYAFHSEAFFEEMPESVWQFACESAQPVETSACPEKSDPLYRPADVQ
jgi:hypothetical protein